ncbi:hypothetical protein V1506DRAFT_548052, partial [Lipomyces tetrasporus]
MFMYSLAPLLDKDKVVINMLCPGMVNTSMSDVFPIHLRLVVNVVKAITVRPVGQGVWLILNAAVVAGMSRMVNYSKIKISRCEYFFLCFPPPLMIHRLTENVILETIRILPY